MMYSIHHIHISCLALHISLWILPIQYGIAADFLYRIKTDDAICVFDITSFHRQVEHTHIRQKHTRKRKQSSNRNPFCLSDYEQFARRTYLYMKKTDGCTPGSSDMCLSWYVRIDNCAPGDKSIAEWRQRFDEFKRIRWRLGERVKGAVVTAAAEKAIQPTTAKGENVQTNDEHWAFAIAALAMMQ